MKQKMNNFLKELEKKIYEGLNPERIQIIDNSYLHTKHKSFDINKSHLKLVIHSKKLKKLKRTEAHKIIFSLLIKEMQDKIHALEIEIK